MGRATQAAEPIELCPVCGASVKASEMAEHVRIELLDPRWKDQRNTYQSKQRDSNLVPRKFYLIDLIKCFGWLIVWQNITFEYTNHL